MQTTLTSGEWVVDGTSPKLIDEDGGSAYLMGNRGDPKQAHLFRVSLAGGAMEQITKGEGYVQRGSNAQSSWSVGRSDVLSPCRALPLAVHTWSRSRVASIASSTVTTPRRSQWWCASATLPTALCSECFMTARLSQVHLARTKRSKVPGQAQLLIHRVKARCGWLP